MAKQTVEELEVLITANADKLRLELQNTNTKLSELQNQVQGVNKSIGTNLVGSILKANIATKVLVGVLRTTVNTTKSVITKTFQLGSQYTRLKTATEVVTRNMGMTTEQVEGLRNALEDANTYGSQAENVIKTLALSGLVDMANGLKTIDARTGKAVEGTTALILAMKDLGATAGIDSAEAIERLTKFVRRGELTFADGLVEIGNINMAYKEYADSIGKSVMELSAQERAQVRLNIVMEEGRKSLGAYASTMQTSGKAVLSIGNVVTTLYERLGSYLEPIFASISLAVFNFVDSTRTALISNAQTFQQWAIRVAGYVVAVVRVLGTWLSAIPGIGKYFESLANFSLKPVAVTFGKIDENANKASSGMDKATSSAKKLNKQLAGFDEMTVLNKEEGGGGVAGGISSGLGDMSKIFDVSAMNEQVNQINKIADEVRDSVEDKMKKIRDALETTGKAVLVFLAIFMGLKTISLIGSAVSGVTTIFGGLGKILTGLNPTVLIIIGVIAVLAGLAYIVWKNWEPISGWFKKMWEDIKTWFNEGIAGITALFDAVVGFFKNKIDYMGVMINRFVTDVVNWFKGMGTSIGNAFDTVKNTVVSIFNRISDSVKNIIGNVLNWIEDRFSKVKGFFSNLGLTIVEVIKKPINAIIKGLNVFIDSVNKIKMPDWVPGVGGKGISIKKISYLAKGGIIDSPTMAVIGEAGREAVLPLDRNTEWIDLLASKINSRGGGEPINIVVKIGDDKVGEKVIDYINDKGLRLGSTVLNI